MHLLSLLALDSRWSLVYLNCLSPPWWLMVLAIPVWLETIHFVHRSDCPSETEWSSWGFVACFRSQYFCKAVVVDADSFRFVRFAPIDSARMTWSAMTLLTPQTAWLRSAPGHPPFEGHRRRLHWPPGLNQMMIAFLDVHQSDFASCMPVRSRVWHHLYGPVHWVEMNRSDSSHHYSHDSLEDVAWQWEEHQRRLEYSFSVCFFQLVWLSWCSNLISVNI